MLLPFTLLAGVALAAELQWPQLHKRGNCSSLELIIARGTGEPLAPSYGLIVGDPLFEATKALIPDLTGYKVNYPADLSCPSRAIGVNDTLNHLYTQAVTCPQQSFALVGYSQGAEVMHYAGTKIWPIVYPRIIAVVEFGDPGHRGPKAISPFGGVVPPFPPELAKKLRENCADGDPVCTTNGTNGAAHLSYSLPGTPFIPESAQYIKKQLDAGGKAGPEPSNNRGPEEPTPENVSALFALGAELGAGQSTCSTFPTPPATTASPTATASPSASSTAGALVTPRAKMRI